MAETGHLHLRLMADKLHRESCSDILSTKFKHRQTPDCDWQQDQ